ncbi:hypothetical protein DPMN_017485 [Dreissena polymorpha]|uniref:Uncharacterized protein n=1 Tax=Dreissena polymorpha TaxID=45954 RepID=A0A9D4S7H3_DREPO|nr:hypothetical protein DPMN_017485 [Dreissena polymorpha]
MPMVSYNAASEVDSNYVGVLGPCQWSHIMQPQSVGTMPMVSYNAASEVDSM